MSAERQMAEFREWYLGLDTEAQMQGLAKIGTHLTIAGRQAYVPGSEEITHPILLRRTNEIQHQIFGQLGKLLAEDPARYSDEGFAEILIGGFTSIPFDMALMMRDLKALP